jgi:hypothetical protein
VGIRGFELRRGTDRNDLFIAHDDRAVFDDAKRTEGFAALWSAAEGEELGGGVDEHNVNSQVLIRDWQPNSLFI